MDSNLTRSKLFLGTGCSVILLIASCTQVKEDSEQEYAMESEAVPLCKSAVRDEVAFQWGWQPEVRFHVADKKPVTSRKVLVTGRGMAKDRKNPRSFGYRCVIDVQAGRVAEIELNWPEKQDHANRKGLALCQDEVIARVRRTHDTSARLAFGSSDSQHLFRNIDAITGTAKVHGQSGRGRIEFECEFNRRNDRLNHVDYTWINKPLEPSTASTSNTVAACHASIREKARQNGAIKVRFSPPRIDRRSKRERIVHGDGKLKIRKHWKNMTYQCHVNARNDRINRSSYLLRTGTTPSTRPNDELVEQCEKAVTRKIADIESDLDVNLYAIKFNPKKWKQLKRGKKRIKGKVKLSGEGLARVYPFSCTIDIYSGKVTDTTLNY